MSVSYAKVPLRFEVNQGQTDQGVKFVSRGNGYTLFLTDNEAVLTLRSPQARSKGKWQKAKGKSVFGPRFGLLAPNPQALIPDPEPTTDERQLPTDGLAVVRMRLVGANPGAQVLGLDELPGKSNYFIGKDPKKWRTNVANYAKVQYKDVYPGVDLIYYGNQGKVEHDFVVSPGADPAAIRLAVDGADGLRLDGQGNLVAQLTSGEVILNRPTIYQPVSNPKSLAANPAKRPVTGSYLLLAENRIGFELGAYDRTQPLVIDPVLEYSTYLGGSSDDWGYGIAVDSAGNVYVTGETGWSPDFPTVNPVQVDHGGYYDAFVAKLNAAGDALLYSTYLGGSDDDVGGAIAVDTSGNAYVTGYTSSADFPTMNPLQADHAGGFDDAFVVKLNAAGDALLYSTYLGGSDNEAGFGIALDASGNAHVAGFTGSLDFPTMNPLQADHAGGVDDAFVAKLSAAGDALLYSTYLGGSDFDVGEAIAVDASGNAYLTGFTDSLDFPTMNPLQADHAGGFDDAFVVKLNAAGDALLYSTYLGGGDNEAGLAIAVGASGNVYVTGYTFSADFPIVNAFQPGHAGGALDAFVTKLSAAGDALLYSTYLGGSDDDQGIGIVTDTSGNAYVTGWTESADFPILNPLQVFHPAIGDAFVTKLNAAGDALLYSTYLGGSGHDWGVGIAVDAPGNAYITGATGSIDFPTVNPLQPDHGGSDDGNFDAFVAKISTALGPAVALSESSLYFGNQLVGTTSAGKSVTLNNLGDGALSISRIEASGDFALGGNSTCGASVAAGGNCAIEVVFMPAAVYARTGSLTINSNASGSPHTVALTGTGTDFSLNMQSGGSTSTTVNAGQTARYSLQVEPTGFSGRVDLACAFPGSTPRGASCSVSPASVTLNGTDPAPFTVNVTTTARSMVGPQTRFTLPNDWARHGAPLLASMLFTLFGAAVLRRRRACMVLATALVCVALWAACGGAGGVADGFPPQTGTPAGNYTLTVTGTVGSLSHQTTLALTVN